MPRRCVGHVFSKNAAANAVISKDRASATELRIRAEYFKLVDNVTRCGLSWYILIACFIRLNYLNIPHLLQRK